VILLHAEYIHVEGQQLRYVGAGGEFEDVIIKGDPAEMKFVAYYVKEGKIIAVSR
jgi:apoptosis-inducing factor 3